MWRTGDRYRTAAPRSPPSGARNAIARKADDLGQEARRRRSRPAGRPRPANRNVEVTRPSSRSVDERLAHGHLGDVVDGHGRVRDELLADQAGDRHERQAGRGQRDEQVAETPTGAAPRSRPGRSPSACVDRLATTAPMNDDAPPTPAMSPTAAGLELELLEREQEPGRAEDAPQRREQHLGDREGAQDRVVDDQPEADADLVEHRLAIRDRRRRRLLAPDRPEQHRRGQERHGVDERS